MNCSLGGNIPKSPSAHIWSSYYVEAEVQTSTIPSLWNQIWLRGRNGQWGGSTLLNWHKGGLCSQLGYEPSIIAPHTHTVSVWASPSSARTQIQGLTCVRQEPYSWAVFPGFLLLLFGELTYNSWSSCLSLPSARIACICCHVLLCSLTFFLGKSHDTSLDVAFHDTSLDVAFVSPQPPAYA